MDELRKLDEVMLLELLEINADDLIDAFLDRVEDNKERLYKYVYE